MNGAQGEKLGIEDESWDWVASQNGKIRTQIKFMQGVEGNTVWTWSAIAKQGDAWELDKDANEASVAFLMNHLISEFLPSKTILADITNSDPITGQAAWYDLCVSITPAVAEAERQPACVLTYLTSSRVFGDFDDPNSKVSVLTRERGGKGLMPELGYNPVNQ